MLKPALEGLSVYKRENKKWKKLFLLTLQPMKPLATKLWRTLTESAQRGVSWNYQVGRSSEQDHSPEEPRRVQGMASVPGYAAAATCWGHWWKPTVPTGIMETLTLWSVLEPIKDALVGHPGDSVS